MLAMRKMTKKYSEITERFWPKFLSDKINPVYSVAYKESHSLRTFVNSINCDSFAIDLSWNLRIIIKQWRNNCKLIAISNRIALRLNGKFTANWIALESQSYLRSVFLRLYSTTETTTTFKLNCHTSCKACSFSTL